MKIFLSTRVANASDYIWENYIRIVHQGMGKWTTEKYTSMKYCYSNYLLLSRDLISR
jgi:hypothetical protein